MPGVNHSQQWNLWKMRQLQFFLTAHRKTTSKKLNFCNLGRKLVLFFSTCVSCLPSSTIQRSGTGGPSGIPGTAGAATALTGGWVREEGSPHRPGECLADQGTDWGFFTLPQWTFEGWQQEAAWQKCESSLQIFEEQGIASVAPTCLGRVKLCSGERAAQLAQLLTVVLLWITFISTDEIQSVPTNEIYRCPSKTYRSLIHGQWSGFKGNWEVSAVVGVENLDSPGITVVSL